MPVPNPRGLPFDEYKAIVNTAAAALGCSVQEMQSTDLLYLCPLEIEQLSGKINRTSKVFSDQFIIADARVTTKFTGWKYSPARCEKTQQPSFVAQWLAYIDHGTPQAKYFYVNIPGKQQGSFDARGTFEVGDSGLTGSESVGTIERLIETSFNDLIELVKRETGVEV